MVCHRSAVRTLREATPYLSLAMHGNNHTTHELRSLRTPANAVAAMAEGLRRVRRFEQRTGLSVSRIMVPPHESCSELAMEAMVRVGLEGVSMTRPYSWLEGDRGYPYADLRVFRPLAGWGPAELIAPGVPVIVRRGLDEDDAVLRAFLDQPVVQYCHAADLRSGSLRWSEWLRSSTRTPTSAGAAWRRSRAATSRPETKAPSSNSSHRRIESTSRRQTG